MGKQQQAPATSTVTNKTELPKWVEAASEANYKQAQGVANNLAQPYSGNQVAGLNSDQQNAFQMTRDTSTSALPYINQGANAVGQAAAYNPQQVQAGSFLTGNLPGYMNPYTDQVETGALGAIERSRLNAQNDTGAKAASMNAFGGNRQAILEALTNSEAGRVSGETSGKIRSDAFNTAAALQSADQNRALQADTSNQAAGLTANQQRMLAGSALGSLGSQYQQSALQGASAVQAIGNQQQQQDQALLQQQANQYEAQRSYPIEQLDLQMQALGMSPYGKTSTQNSTSDSGAKSNPFLTALGGASTGASLAGSLNMTGAMGGFGGGLFSGAGALLGLLSDEKTKTNIQKLGKHPGTGLPVYAYDYKADVEKAKKAGAPMGPKRVGPMAQDVEKMFPGKTGKIGGKRVIANLGFGGGFPNG